MENEMIELMTPKERLEKIKEAIKSHRIAMNYTQKELAQKSGIPLPTYKRFEQTGEVQLSSFLNILYVLGLNDWIKTLMTPYFNPFDDKKINKKRVRK